MDLHFIPLAGRSKLFKHFLPKTIYSFCQSNYLFCISMGGRNSVKHKTLSYFFLSVFAYTKLHFVFLCYQICWLWSSCILSNSNPGVISVCIFLGWDLVFSGCSNSGNCFTLTLPECEKKRCTWLPLALW